MIERVRIAAILNLIFTGAMVASVGWSQPESLTTKPAKPRIESEQAALSRAIDKLVAEHQQYLKDSNKYLRGESDYFRLVPAPQVSARGVLLMLERSISTDPRTDYYVKWQLLSAVTGKFDAEISDRAVTVYQRTPTLMTRPGISAREKHEMDLAIQGRRHEDEESIEYKHLSLVARFNSHNSPILHFRDNLYSRLQVSDRSLLAGIDDLSQRLAAGINGLEITALVSALTRDARYFAESDPPAKQVQAVLRGITKLSAAKGPQYYQTVKWLPDQSRLVWEVHSATLNENNVLTDLSVELQARVARRTSTATTRSE